VSSAQIRNARLDDLPAALALVRSAGLPEDLEPHFRNFVVADRDGVVIGAAGLEIHGNRALLRSLVVAPSSRTVGIGSSLTRAVIEEARQGSIREVFLLTLDAARLFERLGFRHVERAEAPAEIRKTREFSELCPSTARLMKLTLEPPVSS
jgi:N-acetylglutamate synthase-like GNAT family acetyltransferase